MIELLIILFGSGLLSVIICYIYKYHAHQHSNEINKKEFIIELLIILFGGVGSFVILCLIASENLESKNRNLKSRLKDIKKYRGY